MRRVVGLETQCVIDYGIRTARKNETKWYDGKIARVAR